MNLSFYLRFFVVFLFISFAFIYFSPEKFGFLTFKKGLSFSEENKEYNILLLGKPGYGYIGSENTDSIIALHFSLKNPSKIYLIPIPRDLIVTDENGELEKINMLYSKRKINYLLNKVSELTGLKFEKYFVYDLHFVLGLAEVLGGIEVNLDAYVTDAVSLYTISPGKKILKGDDLELVLRSRYFPEGDFKRIKNQIEVIKGLKNKFFSLSNKEKIEILKFALKNKNHWETNMNYDEIYFLLSQSEKFKNAQIKTIFLSTQNGFFTSGYFKIKGIDGVYGIYPKLGLENFSAVREYIRSEIKK
jgi:LCP family protein required for cell wall assembly